MVFSVIILSYCPIFFNFAAAGFVLLCFPVLFFWYFLAFPVATDNKLWPWALRGRTGLLRRPRTLISDHQVRPYICICLFYSDFFLFKFSFLSLYLFNHHQVIYSYLSQPFKIDFFVFNFIFDVCYFSIFIQPPFDYLDYFNLVN